MSRERTTLAILFADLVKSTQLYETLGNDTAQLVVNRCLELLARIGIHYRGTVIKTIGDEIMCAFEQPEDAVKAAKEMNKSIEALSFPELPGFQAPNIHVGIQCGPVISRSADVFGDAVNMASGMVALAKPRQIIVGRQVIEALSPKTRQSARLADHTVVKGKSGEFDIYEIIWEHQDVTLILDEGLESPGTRCGIQLRFQDQALSIDPYYPSASLGRQPHNDIVVPNDRVSRSHARIEYRRGKFILIDQSTNGTFVTVTGRPAVLIRREEFVLVESGTIGLGREVPPDSPEAIFYRIEPS